MGLQKVAFNFMVERGGKLAKSLLCKKTVLGPINFKGLKYVPTLAKDTEQLSQTIGKHKIPRYLYHMTSFENFQKIIESGFINPSSYHKQVYMLELDSFSKYWSSADRNNLCNYILEFQKGRNSGLVMLRIPTTNLSNIKIRPRNRINNKNISFDERMNAIQGNIDAKCTSLYKQLKSDLEFMYNNEIPINQVELVGIYNTASESIRDKNICKTIFEKIFKGQPEEQFLKGWRE